MGVVYKLDKATYLNKTALPKNPRDNQWPYVCMLVFSSCNHGVLTFLSQILWKQLFIHLKAIIQEKSLVIRSCRNHFIGWRTTGSFVKRTKLSALVCYFENPIAHVVWLHHCPLVSMGQTLMSQMWILPEGEMNWMIANLNQVAQQPALSLRRTIWEKSRIFP